VASKNCFPTPPRASIAAFHEVQPTASTSQEPFDQSGLKPDGAPSLVSLVLSAFDCLLRGPAFCLTVPIPSDLSELNPGSPPW
jgi:hypothetical protein